MIIEWSSGCARATNDTRDFALNQKPVLLLHCNGTDAATSFPDSSPSNHTVTANGNAQVDTAQSKWGGAAALFDGTGDYLSIPDSANWDVVGSATDKQTIDFWVKHTDHVGSETYLTQMETMPTDRWFIRHVHGTGILFEVSSTTTIITLGPAGEIADTNWHHVAVFKVAAEYGLYKDGTQIAHTSDVSTDTLAGSLYIGCDGGTAPMGGYFAGHIEEIRIVPANVFNASPVVGLTDKIMVPSRQYISWR